MSEDRRIIIVANGSLQYLEAARRLIRPGDLVVAADGGSGHCRRLGITPDVLIGDLDSTSSAEVAALESAGTRVIRHPVRKDQTDLELALRWAIQNEAGEIFVLGALGGRWDQTLANLLLPALPAFDEVNLRLVDGPQKIVAVRGPGVVALTGAPGDIVSLIPAGGPVTGITTSGLEYPLVDGVIEFGSTLGVSNVLTAPSATVAIKSGWLVCVVITSENAA